MDFAERLKKARKHRKITQEKLAQEIGISRAFISQMEMGVENPSNRTIKDVSRVCNVSEEWLRTGDGVMELPETDELGAILDDYIEYRDTEFGRLVESAMRTYTRAPKEVRATLDAWLKETLETYNKKSTP